MVAGKFRENEKRVMNIKLLNHASEVDSKWSHLNWKGEEICVIVNTIAGFQIMENKNKKQILLIQKNLNH